MPYTKLSPEEIRATVFEEAKKQFLIRGIANTEMKQIAATIGIGRTTLYRYFPQKERLAFMVSLELIKKFFYVNLTANTDSKINGFTKLREFCNRFINEVVKYPSELTFFSEFDHLFMTEYPIFPEAIEYEKQMKANIESIALLIVEGQADHSIKENVKGITFASILVNTIMGLGQRMIARNMHYMKEHGAAGESIMHEAIILLLEAVHKDK